MNKIFLILSFILFSQVSAFKFLCDICTWICEKHKTDLRSDEKINKQLKEYYDTCIKTNSETFCKGRITNVLPYEYRASISKYNCEEICNSYWFCNIVKYEKDTTKSFEGKHLAHSPPFTSYEGLAPNNDKPIKFLVVTDIHMDFDYLPVILKLTYRT
jgi:hypothetical protein